MQNIIIPLFLASLLTAHGAERVAVAFLHRHGHRQPLNSYPTDPNKEFPGGFGSLAQIGVQELYYHGQRMRIRYDSLVQNCGLYSAENTNVLSSALERVIMSGLSFEAGFQYAVNDNLPIPWQPVPITTLAPDEDNMINPTAPCPKYNQQYQHFLDNPPKSVQEFLATHPGFYKNLSEKSGLVINNTDNFYYLYDCVKNEQKLGLIIPDWANEILVEGLWLYQREFTIWTETEYMKKVQYGALINDILNKFLAIKNGTDTRKIFHYSGHDNTIVGLAFILGVHDQIDSTPDYGATISLELYLDPVENSYCVRPYYWASANTIFPKKLRLPKCGHECPLGDFHRHVKKYLINSRGTFNKLCQL